MSYFLTFRARGEVAEMLLLGGEEPRLLVDLSTEPLCDDHGPRRHTPRASFTITDPELMRRFVAEVKVGDITEAEGAFEQGDYTPHRTTCIDTIFTIVSFRRIARSSMPRGTTQIGVTEPAATVRAAPPALLH